MIHVQMWSQYIAMFVVQVTNKQGWMFLAMKKQKSIIYKKPDGIQWDNQRSMIIHGNTWKY